MYDVKRQTSGQTGPITHNIAIESVVSGLVTAGVAVRHLGKERSEGKWGAFVIFLLLALSAATSFAGGITTILMAIS